MKVSLCLAALFLLAFLTVAAFSQSSAKPDRSAAWEYTQITNPSDEVLNHYATDGWEIASAVWEGSYTRVFLKRSKSHPRFGTQTPPLTAAAPKPQPPPPPSTCKLTLAQAPAIRGLRLGMTSEELFAIFPANEREEFDRAQKLKSAELAPYYGSTYFDFRPAGYATRDRFTGVQSIRSHLLDGKVVAIIAQYSNAPQFDSREQLMEIVTKQLGLPAFKDWPDSNSSTLLCDGFKFWVNGYSGDFSVGLEDPTIFKILEERRKTDLAKKRVGFTL
jgi:hypothetical protein